ncbi:MAG TPA: class I SAM-dependent methyltransferase [Candidatus Binatia bacterium]|nr:class I SAM-dependent methyltransferase [Candidatus Binatia bacterium]
MDRSTEAPRERMDERALAVARACRGFLDEDEGLRLHELARTHAALGPILEIGSYCGKSSVYLGAGARAAGGKLVCVDHHRGNEEQQPGEQYHDPEVFDPVAGAVETLPELRRTLRAADLEPTAILIVARSRDAAALWSVPLGLVFIDGGHTHEAAHGDYESWAPHLARGGILAIHDLFPNPADGGQAPIEVYRRALASGDYDELPGTKTLGVLRRR